MSEKIVEAVARGIFKAWQKGDEFSIDDGSVVIEAESTLWREFVPAARAAIEAYEAEKRKPEEPYVTRVEKGVTYWSNGLCSQSVPGSKEFAEEQIRRLSIR